MWRGVKEKTKKNYCLKNTQGKTQNFVFYKINLIKKNIMEMVIIIIVLFVSAILAALFIPNSKVSDHPKDSEV